jgi:hypothetical protein
MLDTYAKRISCGENRLYGFGKTSTQLINEGLKFTLFSLSVIHETDDDITAL